MDLLYTLALTKIKGVGLATARNLLSHFGSAETLFLAPRAELESIRGIGPQLAAAIHRSTILAEAEAELRYLEQHGIQALHYEASNYPERLKNCPDAPLLLYYRGTANLNSPRIVSIVGTRKCTAYGKHLCAGFINGLAPYQVLVISGLAHGIDSHAHRAALTEKLPTVAVMGHGLDRVYPLGNTELAKQMVENGGLLSEYPIGTPPEKHHFPMRNRIIAGLADVTVVVEAAIRGGALITAELANGYNRDVCAFPGNIGQDASAGCNHLIKTNRAHLISSAKDLAYLMNWTIEQTPKTAQRPAVTLSDTAQQLYDTISLLGRTDMDTITSRLLWPQGTLAAALLELEIKGMIQALPGKTFQIFQSN